MLGHVVTRDGIATDPEKVRVIKEWPVPEDESQLKAFLGTASYYRQFMPNYAVIAAPLHSASQKGERFRWTVQYVKKPSGWERARYSLCGTCTF